MNQSKIDEIIMEDRRQWQLLVNLLESRAGLPLHAPPAKPWKSQDVYAHLARWLEHSNSDIEAYLQGHNLSPPISNPEELNALWQTEDSHMSLVQARAKAFKAFEDRMRILRSIPPERWDARLERIAAYDGAEHYKMHINYITFYKVI